MNLLRYCDAAGLRSAVPHNPPMGSVYFYDHLAADHNLDGFTYVLKQSGNINLKVIQLKQQTLDLPLVTMAISKALHLGKVISLVCAFSARESGDTKLTPRA